jgi:hypothetical protein
MNTKNFRTETEEVVKLLDEYRELKSLLREISGRLSRIEIRLKKVFPLSAARSDEKARHTRKGSDAGPMLTPQQAEEVFDEAVRLARNNPEEAEAFLSNKHSSELLAVAKELGISFSKSKPSPRATREAIYGKIRESLLLSHHSPHLKRGGS